MISQWKWVKYMKKNGVLMAISSLPSPYGIGDLGPSAFAFVDYLAETGVNIWQILPFNRLGYGNSPYQTFSSIAGDEIFISIDALVADGYLRANDVSPFAEDAIRVDYTAVRLFKMKYLRKAFSHFQENFQLYEHAYLSFLDENPWIYDYSVFQTLHHAQGDTSWINWSPEYRDWVYHRDMDLSMYAEDIAFNQFLQFVFYAQWHRLKRYANAKGIALMGDIPIYVGIDSVDVWANRDYFLLNDRYEPAYVAGVPPDYFQAEGQRWGNPIYNWDALERDGFGFWMERLGQNQKVFDSIRLDHFRAFDTYWKIPAGEETAVRGEWVEAPGYAFFDKLFEVLPDIKLFVEDLGYLRPEVFMLRDHYKFMGMEIIQFSFEHENLPTKETQEENKIAYTGTHDNQTTLGWFLKQSEAKQEQIRQYLNKLGYEGSITDQMIQYTLDSHARIAIIPIWDILGLDDSARMNTPGTVGSPNWEWKLSDYNLLKEKLKQYAQWLAKYNRTSQC